MGNRFTLGADATDTYQPSCPKCGGTKPTCCSCPDDNVPKLMTTREWESLSAASRFKINAHFAVTPPATPVVAREVIELFRDTAMKAHVLAVHKCGFEECEWAECEERKKMINELDAATTPPSETAVGGETHAKNPNAFCLVCNEHPCKLITAANG